MSFFVAGLWRYPVKSLAGERLMVATLEPDGIIGDRIVRVRGPEGVRTSRRDYRLLGLRGTIDANGRKLRRVIYRWTGPFYSKNQLTRKSLTLRQRTQKK